MAKPIIFTVGHSTRTEEEFVSLLAAHGIRCVIDVRTVPKSLKNPQFAGDNLAAVLSGRGIRYLHVPEAGGLRSPGKDSPNTAWRNRSFRGYADHMASAEFKKGLERIGEAASAEPAALMCAEAVPWRCHRFLLSDALVVGGWEVRHIISAAEPKIHERNPSLRLKGGVIVYPKDGAQELPI